MREKMIIPDAPAEEGSPEGNGPKSPQQKQRPDDFYLGLLYDLDAEEEKRKKISLQKSSLA